MKMLNEQKNFFLEMDHCAPPKYVDYENWSLVVIDYDRWWNAARERQATDRVYRIGQRRGVQVFKLLTLWALEEGIDKMIERKGELMEEVVRSDDQGQIKQFSREELAQLLSWPN